MIKRFFRWVFRAELDKLNKATQHAEILNQRMLHLLGSVDISVDVNINDRWRARSWAVISLQGQKADFIKFYDLSDWELYAIQQFLRQFDRDMAIKIDAAPVDSAFLRFDRNKK